jgi:protocatechuate 3,4-dioxygenase beta subunit
MQDHSRVDDRRKFVRFCAALPSAFVLSAWSGHESARAQELPPTPACSRGEEPTPRQMEGPFFKPRSPRRASLLDAGVHGTKLLVGGLVLSTQCQPIAGALLDFWQCDDEGNYDNGGYRLRGHQFSDDAGRFRLETIVPGLYPGRTRHIHVKVQAPSRPVLTTQLYFPGEPSNQDDFLFRPELLIAMTDTAGSKAGRFDFVLTVG